VKTIGKGGHRTIVEALIKKYADIDIKGKDNKTCLHWAIDKNHTAIVKLLLSANPDLVNTWQSHLVRFS
jgi:ankyrin repeat-rich membrane spanning protein